MPVDSRRPDLVVSVHDSQPLDTWEIEGRAFPAKMLPAGESVFGFFYFQTQNIPGSKIYLTEINDAQTGKDYFYFEVPFEPEK
jgi:hypothetical protein